jgi:hypothetical protein
MAFTDSIGALGRADTLASRTPAASCPLHAGWCREHQPSGFDGTMHLSAELPVRLPSGDLVDFQVLADDGVEPLVAFGDADMTPSEARRRIAELQTQLARIEAQLALVESGPFAAS